jgi:hypothetical protein
MELSSIAQRAGRVGRAAHARGGAVSCLYQTAGGSTPVRLVPALSRTESTTEGGVIITRQLNDWIGELADLPGYPQRGDLIVPQHADWQNRRFMVIHPGGGREADYHDTFNESARIHTVEIAPSSAVGADEGYVNPNDVSYANPSEVIYGGPP